MVDVTTRCSTRSTRRALAFTTAVVAFAATAAAGTAGAAPAPTDAPEADPPAKVVYMITDSVGLGAKDALPRAFPSDWQIVLDGDAGEFTETLENKYVKPRIATDPGAFAGVAVVAAGYNYPYWDPERFDRSIDTMVATLTAAGVRQVFWVTLREVQQQYVTPGAWRQIQPYYWYFPTVNEHLERALERHPNLTLVDWAAVADRPGLTYDAIHLNTAGAELYTSLIRETVVASQTAVGNGSITRVVVPGAAGAAAASVNVATTGPRTAGFLTGFDCSGGAPLASFHNHRRDEIAAHATIVPLDADGAFCLATRAATNLVVDVTGTFAEGAGYLPIGPERWADTRATGTGSPVADGGRLVLDLDDLAGPLAVAGTSPGDVAAVAVSVTATGTTGPGFLEASCDTTGATSNVNYAGGDTVPNLAIAVPDAEHRVCVYTSRAAHVVVDLIGVFDSSAAVGGGPATRAFDSRDAGSPVEGGAVTTIDVAGAGVPAGAAGVVVNLTALDATAPGFASLYPCADGRPASSSLNIPPFAVVSNASIVAPDDDGRICVFTLSTAHLVVDVLGSIGAGFAGRAPVRLLDTRIDRLPVGWP